MACKSVGAGSAAGRNARRVASRRGPKAARAAAAAVAGAKAAIKPSPPVLSVGILGRGLIGAELLAQVKAQGAALADRAEIRVVGLCGSSSMLLAGPEGSPDAMGALAAGGVPADLEAFSAHVLGSGDHAVIVDCTASEEPSAMYSSWLNQGIHVVTPNKKTGSGALAEYDACRAAEGASGALWMYETTVGAGLPVISTLKGLLDTGDKVTKIEGILSGTLSYIFNTFDGSSPFSEVVEQAKAQGFTEPDPREDLNGLDVARKVTILARECGLKIELDDIPVESLVPEEYCDQDSCTVDEYMTGLPDFDGGMAAQVADAAKEGCVLRFVGSIDVAAGTASVGLQRFPNDHPFAGLAGADNIVSFTTERYSPPTGQPLVIRGPGAGAAVTSAGCFSDLLQVARACGMSN